MFKADWPMLQDIVSIWSSVMLDMHLQALRILVQH